MRTTERRPRGFSRLSPVQSFLFGHCRAVVVYDCSETPPPAGNSPSPPPSCEPVGRLSAPIFVRPAGHRSDHKPHTTLKETIAMAIEVRIPTILRNLTDGAKVVEGKGGTLEELFTDL